MATKRDSDYPVGYKRPPRDTRFKKGGSGNPKGRPRGSKSATTLLKEALSEQVVISENGRRRTITKKEAIITQVVNKAASGDHRAIQLLLVNQIPLIEARLESSRPEAIPIELARAFIKDVESPRALSSLAKDDDADSAPLDVAEVRRVLKEGGNSK